MTAFVVILIVFPSVYILSMLTHEAISAYAFFENGLNTGRFQSILELKDHPFIQGLWNQLNQYVDLSEIDLNSLLLENVRRVSTFAINQTSKIIKGFSFIIVNFCLVTISLYYVFKDGDQLLRKIREAIPLVPQDRDLLFSRLEEMVYATIYGGIFVAILQGFLGGFAFWFLGLSSPVFWGTVMVFLSFLPIVGPFLVWGPVVVYFFFQGSILLLISKRTKLHTMLLFFGVLGGIKSFGLLGLIVGPLVVTICITILDIYSEKAAQTAPSGV